MKAIPKKGDILYRVKSQRVYTGSVDGRLYEHSSSPMFVVKVGRKFFYIAENPYETKDNRVSQIDKEAYAAGRLELFIGWDDYFQSKETVRLHQSLRDVFSAYGPSRLTYNQLRAIANVLGLE